MSETANSKKTSRAGEIILWVSVFVAVASMPQTVALPYVGPIFDYLGSVAIVVMGAIARAGLVAARDDNVSDQEARARVPDPNHPGGFVNANDVPAIDFHNTPKAGL